MYFWKDSENHTFSKKDKTSKIFTSCINKQGCQHSETVWRKKKVEKRKTWLSKHKIIGGHEKWTKGVIEQMLSDYKKQI